MTVGTLLRTMGSREVSEWAALYQIENDERTEAALMAKTDSKMRR